MNVPFRRVWMILSLSAAALAQDKPPVSLVPEPFRQKFVHYVDRRSIQEKALNLIGLTSQDVGRSYALIAGVSKYPNMPMIERDLPPAAADVEMLQSYLKNHEFFDEIVVLRDGDVTLDNLEYFLQNYFPDRLKKSPKSRFLFAYSGHGMAEGSKEYPTGYLLKSTARSLTDKVNGINMSVVRVYLDQVIDAGYQTIALINACHSGAFLSRRAFGTGAQTAGGAYFPKNGGAHAITAGGSNQLSWHVPKLGKGSVFFEKLLAGLGGQADLFPIQSSGGRGDGLITLDEIATYLREEVSLATNQEQIPLPADLSLNRSLGGFFFLNRQKMVASGIVSEWNPRRSTAFGIQTAEMLSTARDAYSKKDYDKAVRLFVEAADAGSAEASAYLGFIYMNGLGVAKDDAQAFNWYRKAADGGNATGIASLGFMYENGRGVAKDDVQAANLYRKAAEAGVSASMVGLAVMYSTGRGGLPKDDAQAVSWLRKAADSGDATGMSNLGLMYLSGRGGLPKDEAQAVSWYRKAADGGNAMGMAGLGAMYANGRGGLPRDDAQALSWFRKAAEGGDPTGMNNLGVAYSGGRGVPKDDAQAATWFRKAAESGSALGMTGLGVMYFNGLGGLPKDEAQALSWYRKAAEGGDPAGMANLGAMYSRGQGGLPKDDAQAASWFRKAAESGNAMGMAGLGAMYFNGLGGLPRDDAQALSWFRKAAEGGDGTGMANLGFMYENGRGGLPKDVVQAVTWYRQGAQLGNTSAQAALKRLGY